MASFSQRFNILHKNNEKIDYFFKNLWRNEGRTFLENHKDLSDSLKDKKSFIKWWTD